MPLEPYRRGPTWWAKGRVEYLGTAITQYYRCSTGATEEAGAWDWCRAEEERRIQEHLFGGSQQLSFADAVLLYPSSTKTAQYLIPIVERWGGQAIVDIQPKMIRELAASLYPEASTDTWTRQVLTPIRAVINHAHDLGKCAPLRVKGYTQKERLQQDQRRGKRSRVPKTPGSWEWLLRFRQHADPRHAALAHTMFVTGARISQAIAMHPHRHCKLDDAQICIPAAKGQPDRWLDIPPELVEELRALPLLRPRGADVTSNDSLRLFGFADRSSPRKGWKAACDAAEIPYIPFHAAGRHGFGQEMNVRQRIDEKASAAYGGWSDVGLMKRTYTHGEDVASKIHEAYYRGLREAESATGLTLIGK